MTGCDAPVGTADAYAVPSDGVLSIVAPGFLANDIDLDGEVLTAVSIQDNVDHGVLAAFADGSFTYTPEAGFTGTDSFAYRMRDASNNFSDPIPVTIEVLPAADRGPIGASDAFAMLFGTTLSIAAPGFLANDIDLDGEVITAVSIQDNVDHGTLAAFADGSFTYTPEAGFTGTDSFAYRMRDASNNFSDPIPVTIEVYGGNRPPIGLADQYTAVINTVLSIPAPGFIANDIDLDAEAITAVSIQDNVDHGTLAAFADGSFTYTPEAGFTGADSFAYQMRDASNNFSDPITVTIEVSPTGTTPVATPDLFAVPNDGSLNIAAPGFLANDIDLDGEVITAVSIQDNVDHGVLAAFADGSFTYTPEAGFTGTDTFTYRMRDASNNFAEGTVTIEVLPPANRAPVGGPDQFTMLSETTLSIAAPGFLVNDIDLDGEAVTAVSIQDNVDHGTLAAFADGSFTYTPEAGFTGTDSFAYRMRDASNNFSDPIPVTIEVYGGNRPPIGLADQYTAVINTVLSIPAPGFIANDIDLDAEAITAVSIQDNVDHGTLAAFADGSFTYTPETGFTGTDSFAYRMRDASNNFSDPITVMIDVLDPSLPIVGAITVSANWVPVTTEIHAQVGFSSLASGVHTAEWSWGDGTSASAGVVTEADCEGSVSGNHVYAAPGVYSVTVTVTSAGGSSAQSVFESITVFAPRPGFVTGGGWIDSPAGAWVADPGVTGKAVFNVSCRYVRGALTPTGQVSFQLKAARLRFENTSNEWLVIVGADAFFRGAGTINGGGDYGFLVTATDAEIQGGRTDRFRIRIWDRSNGNAPVYDSAPGKGELEAGDIVGGGNIAIHSGGQFEPTDLSLTVVPERTALLPNAPNPFVAGTRIRFELAPLEAGLVEIDIYDVTGRLVRQFKEDRPNAGAYEVVWTGDTATGEAAPAGVYFYRLRTREFVETRRMIKTQ